MNNRELKRIEIISYLEDLSKTDSQFSTSIQENLIFFEKISSLKGFFDWVKNNMPTINGEQLKELTDFGNEKYSEELHIGMIKVERGFVPGFITPMVKKVSSYILSCNNSLLIADLGSGSAELMRQIIKRVLKSDFKQKITIVAFDRSESSHNIAAENLAVFANDIEITKVPQLKEEELVNIINKSDKKINVILVQNNIFNIAKDFKNTTFDMSYHSFFKHHLDVEYKNELDNILLEKSKITFEYDGFHSKFGLILQALFVWKQLVLLNGAVFSNLRYYKKEFLKGKAKNENIILYGMGPMFSHRGTYLRTLTNADKK